MTTKVYWLIERTKTQNGPGVHWFSERRCFAQGDQDLWVEDTARAQRFDSKDAAERSIKDRFTVDGIFTPDEVYLVIPVATEHLDCDGPDLQEAKP